MQDNAPIITKSAVNPRGSERGKSNKIRNFKSYGQQLQLSGGEEHQEGAARDAIGLKSTGSRKVGGQMGADGKMGSFNRQFQQLHAFCAI